jgi:hypothetical protein
VEVNVQVEGGAETLDQGDGPGSDPTHPRSHFSRHDGSGARAPDDQGTITVARRGVAPARSTAICRLPSRSRRPPRARSNRRWAFRAVCEQSVRIRRVPHDGRPREYDSPRAHIRRAGRVLTGNVPDWRRVRLHLSAPPAAARGCFLRPKSAANREKGPISGCFFFTHQPFAGVRPRPCPARCFICNARSMGYSVCPNRDSC